MHCAISRIIRGGVLSGWVMSWPEPGTYRVASSRAGGPARVVRSLNATVPLLPDTADDRLPATGYPTSDLVTAVLDSHAEHVLVESGRQSELINAAATVSATLNRSSRPVTSRARLAIPRRGTTNHR